MTEEKTMRKTDPRARRRHRKHDRGSALLVSLMVMVGLSLLGLSFVAISETESAISVNERNKTQTTALAEAAAKAVVQWFQDPDTMDARNLLPPNDNLLKTSRTVPGYSGFYKPDTATELLCDTPFGPTQPNMFLGTETTADIEIVDGENTAATAFLASFNTSMFFNDEGGKITSIRIYAPPVVGGSLVGGFWVGGQRYGIATIAVTAQKTNSKGDIIAQSICRIVVAPFPLPGPSGAIQAGGGIATNGAYQVHWGSVESEDDGETFIKREWTSFPWFDAYDRAYIEYGLDSSKVWKANTAYQIGEVVRPTDPAIAKLREYVVVATRAPTHKTHATNEPTWNVAAADWYGGDVQFLKRTPTVYPIAVSTGPLYQRHAWLYEMLKRPVEDPWYTVRTRGRVDGKDYGKGPAGLPHAYDYATQADSNMAGNAGNFVTGGANRSHYFQYQTYNDRPLYKEVSIPKFDYDFWKAAAIAGRGQPGVYYLEHKGGGKFSDGVTTQPFADWIESKQGFLFFDSNNNLNPQNGGAGTLVAGGADVCGAKGVIYMNYDEIKSTGCNGVDGWYNQPGEPFRDIGYRQVNETTSGVNVKGEFTTDAAGTPIVAEGYNGQWDYQDLPWSNNGAVKNDVFDVCVKPRTVTRESDGVQTFYLPVPYYPGCKPGNNISMPACECSEPFEPYLNLDYDGNKVNVQSVWEDPTSVDSVFAKVRTDQMDPTSDPITCATSAVTTEAGQADCATNAYDKRGGLARIAKGAGGAAIGVEGVLYNEGNYNSTGNAAYYGAVVVQGVVSPNGTQEIWFDECLTKDCWPPEHIPFPRVLITSTQFQ
jgi:hypothetical protein